MTTPESNRQDEREAGVYVAALIAMRDERSQMAMRERAMGNERNTTGYQQEADALDRAIALLRRDAPREGAGVDEEAVNVLYDYYGVELRERTEGCIARMAAIKRAIDALTDAPDRAPREGAMTDNSRAGSVTVPRCDLLALLEGNLAAANIALSIHPLIDRIEENGGADAEDDSEQMAYHLYYTLAAAARLRDIAEKPE